ncbi:DUF89 family protein [Heliobacterium chlorum]|uniref:DUF89 family protein n=1 Tax=Heliobacterium chlorum TaxID=2698 RepID=A0ABR7T4B4_HELCL|nr:ARMT1-like domain-containing protein [Heliobacterium chlorum]MBC9785190.1 DUF89 family protein [Heliobacterium chlorum]
MRLYFDCVPCTVQQLTNAVQRFITDEQEQYRILGDAMNGFHGQIHKNTCSPILTAGFYEKIKAATGTDDLYAAEKELFNREMLHLEEDFRRLIEDSDDPVKKAVCLSAAANIIDFGILGDVNKQMARKVILEKANTNREYPDLERLKGELAAAKTLLYIGDNCGEIVLDKLVLETIRRYYPQVEITFAVRSAPILNDVTEKEAYEVGIGQYAKIISSGSTIPGTVLSQCTPEFNQRYRDSDVIILKGMGNIETAAEDERKAYFIFMVKCDFMSRHLKADLQDIFITKGNYLYRKNRIRD